MVQDMEMHFAALSSGALSPCPHIIWHAELPI